MCEGICADISLWMQIQNYLKCIPYYTNNCNVCVWSQRQQTWCCKKLSSIRTFVWLSIFVPLSREQAATNLLILTQTWVFFYSEINSTLIQTHILKLWQKVNKSRYSVANSHKIKYTYSQVTTNRITVTFFFFFFFRKCMKIHDSMKWESSTR